MKSLLLSFLALSTVALAVEPVKLPMDVGTLKTREGKVLEGVKIVGADAVGVKVIHSGGTARLPYERLPKELAARFPRDADAAKEQLEKEAQQEAAHDRSMDQATTREKAKANAESEETDEGGDTAVEGAPELSGSTKARIASLESYIRRLEAGIANSRDLAAKARERAQGIRENSRMTVRETTTTGKTTVTEVDNRSKLKRAEFQEKRAKREEAKIAEAELLITTAREKIEILKKTPAE
jgi:hypothetical protein